MSLFLAYDTETSGLPTKHASPHDEDFPFLVELSMLLVDETGAEFATVSVIVQPPAGRSIPIAASDVHGISNAQALEVGVSPRMALSLWNRLAGKVEGFVGHNIAFDDRIMEASWIRHAGSGLGSYHAIHGQRDRICTQRLAAPILNLPPTEAMKQWPGLRDKPKAPKLAECVRFFFDREIVGAHRALADVRETVNVWLACKTVIERQQSGEDAA